jgi:hypothetical protein
MADVTISQLTQGIPVGGNLLPYSTGSITLGAPVSAMFQNTSSIGINTSIPNTTLDVKGEGIQSFTSIGNNSVGPIALQGVGPTPNPNLNDGYHTCLDFKAGHTNQIAGRIAIQYNHEGSKMKFGTSNLYGTNLITAMEIDRSGRVTTPYQPYLQAYVSTNITNYDFTMQNEPVVKYNYIQKQIGDNYNTSTGLFTAPVSGVYNVHAGVYTITSAGNAAGGICTELWGIINGNRSMTITDLSDPGASTIRHGSGMFYLNAGDTFGIKAHGAPAAGYGIGNYSTHSVLRIAFLG